MLFILFTVPPQNRFSRTQFRTVSFDFNLEFVFISCLFAHFAQGVDAGFQTRSFHTIRQGGNETDRVATGKADAPAEERKLKMGKSGTPRTDSLDV